MLNKSFHLRRFFQALGLTGILHGALGAFSSKTVGSLAGFGLAVLIGRYLGAEQSGIYYTGLTIATIGAYLAVFGMDLTVMRETATAMAARAVGYPTFIRRVLGLLGISSLVLAAAMAVGATPAAQYFEQPNLEWILVVWTAVVVATVIYHVAAQALRGAQRLWVSSFVLFASVNLLMVLLLSGVRALSIGWEPLTVTVGAYALATVLTAVVSGAIAWREVGRSAYAAGGQARSLRDLVATGAAFAVYGLGARGLHWVATLVLARAQDSAQVGLYNAAFRVAFVVGFVLQAVALAVAPRFIRLYHTGCYAQLRRLFAISTLLSAVAGIPLIVGILFYSKHIMALFGVEFIGGSAALRIIAMGPLLSAVTGPSAQVLIATGKENTLRNVTLAVLVCGLCLHLLLVPKFGFLCSAWITAISVAAINIVTCILAWLTLLDRE